MAAKNCHPQGKAQFMPGVRHKDTERTYTGDISEDEP